MSFRRQKDVGTGGSSRRHGIFSGIHGGYGRTDQPDQFAELENLDCFNDNLTRRDGKAKTGETLSADIDLLQELDFGQEDVRLLVVGNGVATAISIGDIA
jgi:hypothetical protein